jgi:cell division protein FtsQ
MIRRILPHWLRAAPYVLLPVGSLLLLGAGTAYHSSKPCTKVNVSVDAPAENLLIDAAEVKNLLGPEENLIGAPLGEIDLGGIEGKLRSSSFIRTAEAWFGANGELNVRIGLRTPMARVISDHGLSFYIDEMGHPMRLSRTYTARTLLVRGPIRQARTAADSLQDSTLRAFLPVLQHIQQNEFLRSQVAELLLNTKGEATLHPEIGQMSIQFGTAEEPADKFARLERFYREVVPKVGAAYYRQLNLKFRNQLIATRNE